MENASKALIMAGSVLMAILVIGLLLFGYHQLSDLEQTKTDAEDNDKIANYMRQFEQFNRTLYGSELLSLANLQEDYNQSDAREDSGYDKIEITVQIKKSPVASQYFKQGNYDISDIVQDKNNLENAIKSYEQPKTKYNNKSVKYYASKSPRELAIDFGMNPPSNSTSYQIQSDYLEKNATTRALLIEIQEYTNLNSIYNEFRTGKKFDCTKVEYNDQNGRLNKMVFVEK